MNGSYTSLGQLRAYIKRQFATRASRNCDRNSLNSVTTPTASRMMADGSGTCEVLFFAPSALIVDPVKTPEGESLKGDIAPLMKPLAGGGSVSKPPDVVPAPNPMFNGLPDASLAAIATTAGLPAAPPITSAD